MLVGIILKPALKSSIESLGISKRILILLDLFHLLSDCHAKLSLKCRKCTL